MHRGDLLDRLRVHRAWNEEEGRSIDRIIDFVAAEPRCFERELESGHVTGSAWIVSPGRDSVLLTHHRKLDRWLQMGGHADGDCDILRVALREAHEESGLASMVPVHDRIFDVDVHAIPARAREPAHFHYDVRFLLEADPSADLVVSSESKAIAWVPLDRLVGLAVDASVLRMAEKTRGARARGEGRSPTNWRVRLS
jgi:8-oxo-dGTP pyrophosphatase MutT (NUDIX family)